MRWSLRILLCLLVAAAPAVRALGGEWDRVAFQQKAPQGIFAWFVLPTRMVLDEADLPANLTDPPAVYRLSAGRNESECIQLVLMLSSPIEKASVEFGEFVTREGMIDPTAWEANLVAQVPGRLPQRSASMIKSWPVREPGAKAETVTPGMYAASASTLVPDPLLRDGVFDLPRGLSRVWLTVHVPKDARPGDYRGIVRLKSGEQTVFEIPLELRVWNFTLPHEPSLNVLANVWSNLPPAPPNDAGVEPKLLWDHLKPYYDNLKAHRINATGEIYPTRAWRREEPPPDLSEYERALKYVLDDLHFARFRFPGISGTASGTWQETPVFQPDLPQQVADGTWISGGAFGQCFPRLEEPSQAEGATPQWTRVAGAGIARDANFGAATIAGYEARPPAWVEYEFETTAAAADEPLFVWLQVEPVQGQERKIVSIDGKEIGAVTSADSMKHPLGFARIEQPVKLEPGAHMLRVTVDDVVGSSDALYGIFVTANHNPDLELLLRERAKLDERFRDAFGYHARQMAEWLRRRHWLKKAHAKMKEEPCVGEYGRVASVYDFVGDVLPSIRREISEQPSPMLRKSAEVWTTNLASPQLGDLDAVQNAIKPSDELWAYHNFLHTLGYPSISMRMIPWTLGRHGIKGYVFWSVNCWAADPWKETTQNGSFMRGTLLYPDPKTGEPVNSVRWELFRQGLEDFETLRLLRTACDEAASDPKLDETRKAAVAEAEKLLGAEVGGVVRSARDFSWDPVELEDLRLRACALLHVLTVEPPHGVEPPH
jgi:hypothetical protein